MWMFDMEMDDGMWIRIVGCGCGRWNADVYADVDVVADDGM